MEEDKYVGPIPGRSVAKRQQGAVPPSSIHLLVMPRIQNQNRKGKQKALTKKKKKKKKKGTKRSSRCGAVGLVAS